MLLLVAAVGGLLWMFILKALAWIAAFPLSWGVGYVIGFFLSLVLGKINLMGTEADLRARFMKRGF